MASFQSACAAFPATSACYQQVEVSAPCPVPAATSHVEALQTVSAHDFIRSENWHPPFCLATRRETHICYQCRRRQPFRALQDDVLECTFCGARILAFGDEPPMPLFDRLERPGAHIASGPVCLSSAAPNSGALPLPRWASQAAFIHRDPLPAQVPLVERLRQLIPWTATSPNLTGFMCDGRLVRWYDCRAGRRHDCGCRRRWHGNRKRLLGRRHRLLPSPAPPPTRLASMRVSNPLVDLRAPVLPIASFASSPPRRMSKALRTETYVEFAKPTGDCCVICLDPMEGTCVRTPCNHYFHEECLEQYVSKSYDCGWIVPPPAPRCPVCRCSMRYLP